MKEKRMLLIGAILEGYRSLKDKTLKVTFESNEPTPEQLVGIATLIGKFGYLAFKEDTFKSDEIDVLQGLESDYEDKGKTPAQRLKSILYLNWKQKDEGYQDFNLYYEFQMNKMSEHWKKKLP